MQADEEGFIYPSIDLGKCVNCGICEKTCPVINKIQNCRDDSQAFAAYNLNEEERLASSSGGVFTLLANMILSEGGVVFGAAMSDDCKAVLHKKIDTVNGLECLRGSKYLQSCIGDVYIQVKKELDNGRKVLFSGTPCQVGGLKAYLKKDYETLLCIEVVCHGVPSSKLWNKYKTFREKRAGSITQRTGKSFTKICICKCFFKIFAFAHPVMSVVLKGEMECQISLLPIVGEQRKSAQN